MATSANRIDVETVKDSASRGVSVAQMKMPTRSTSTSRWVHYSLLWTALAVVVVVSFWRHQTWTNRGLLAAVILLALRGVALTRDAGHLERPRREDPLLSLIGAAGALTLMRAGHAAPILAAALIGVGGGLGVRWFRGARDYHGAPIYVGAFVGITSPLVLRDDRWVLAAGLLAGVVWSLSRDAWVGVGGKMGTMALLATSGVALVAREFHQRGPGTRALDAHGIVVLAVMIGAGAAPLTFYLSHSRGWGAVLGSSVPTVAFALAVSLTPATWPVHGAVLSYLWFGSSFVGMTTPVRLSRPALAVPLAGVLFTWLAFRFGPYLAGVGGTAGFAALVAVFAVRGTTLNSRPRRVLARDSR